MSLRNLPLKCASIHVVNMGPNISGRITISYHSYQDEQGRTLRNWNKLYLHVGRMVVSVSKSPEASALSTLRATLTAIALYPKFLKNQPSVRSRLILNSWANRFLKVNVKKLTRVPLASLFAAASLVMVDLQNSVSGGRISMCSSRDVKAMLLNLHQNVNTLIGFMVLRGNYSPKLKNLYNSHMKSQGYSPLTLQYRR